jgi:dienelactone hydrolase
MDSQCDEGIGKRFTGYGYPHVSHSFFDSKNPQYDTNAEKLAWARTLEFLRPA